ncbi:unnamed protein product [Eretmochelys imbricata]
MGVSWIRIGGLRVMTPEFCFHSVGSSGLEQRAGSQESLVLFTVLPLAIQPCTTILLCPSYSRGIGRFHKSLGCYKVLGVITFILLMPVEWVEIPYSSWHGRNYAFSTLKDYGYTMGIRQGLFSTDAG